MATFRSGNGGYVEISVISAGISGSLVRLDKSKWSLSAGGRLTENTHSGVSSSNYEAVIPDNSWTIEGPWDEGNMPHNAVGLAFGVKCNIYFHVGGGSAKVYTLLNTSVEKADYTDDESSDIVRFSGSGKGGALVLPS